MKLQYKLSIPIICILVLVVGFILIFITNFLKDALLQSEFEGKNELVRNQIPQYLSPENFSDPSSLSSQDQFFKFSEGIRDSSVARLTIWSKDRVIIFSDLSSIIGYYSPDHPDLTPLFDSGAAFFNVKQKDDNKPVQTNIGEFQDIYIPISFDGNVLGAVEIHLVSEALMGPVQQQLNNIIFLIFIAGFGILFAIFFLEQRLIIQPLRNLEKVAKFISSGDLTQRVKIISSDEIGYVTSVFNKMLDNIEKSQIEIKVVNQQLRASEQQLQAGNQQLRASEQQLQAANQQLKGMTLSLNAERDTLDIKVKTRTKELSKEQSKMLSLIESLKLGMIMCDLNLNIILANQSARTILEKPASSIITFDDLDRKIKDGMKISQVVSSYIKTGKLFNLHEVIIKDKYFRIFISLVMDITEKTCIGAVIIIEDVTDQKRIDRMRTEIVSITSHQLRTPLTVIKGNLEMILDGDFGEVSVKQKEILREAFLGNERMIQLVNDLMQVAKIEEGRIQLDLEIIQPEDLVVEIIKDLLPYAEGCNVSLSYIPHSAKLPKVEIDRQKIKVVLQNLIENAVKYTANKKNGKIVVKIRRAKQFLEFSIKDNGIGIPKGEQNKLYDRFFRGSNAAKFDPGGGTGLGLY
ncbi:MAG: ATP-binding protein, partial [Candidatus Parcubacteria bacterium]|nr:ATP-binding protein [Candidatus Parcubacteria bacterium]